MGVGKSTISSMVCKKLINSVWLDGDWCWMMNPWNINDENKKMVVDNIRHLLRNYINNSSFEYIIFSWVMDKKETFSLLLEALSDVTYDKVCVTLMCDEDILIKRMNDDNRTTDNIRDSVSKLNNYSKLETIKIDTTYTSPEDICDSILEVVK